MCGIAGWIDWERDLTQQSAALKRMADTLCHRGPDAQGEWLSHRAALAHRRLYVIDPQGGGQPMHYTTGDHPYVITYNGEIYNFRELRRELETYGHSFHTQSDTEVLLHAYAEWGEDCLHHLNGIFAFALWDEHRQRLFMARDHLGVKPLFYAKRGSAILFGSELKVVLAHPLVKAEIDSRGLAEIFGFRRSPGSGVYRDVHELRAGYKAIFTRDQTHIGPYWTLRSAPHTDDLQTTVEKLRALLEDTVQRQLIADVPVVTMLSGGLDSSGLTALAAQEFRRKGKTLHTYSIDFVDSASDFEGSVMRPDLDAPWVKRVSEFVGSQHHTVMIDTPELVDNILVPLRANDLPVIGQIETSLYLLFKRMKQDATVALSGESADEVFGGYPWFHNEQAINAPIFPWLAMMGPIGSSRATSWLSPELTEKIRLGEFITHQYQEAIAEVPRLKGEDARAAKMREVFYLNLTRFLPMLLERKDLMSMAVGFEVRVPFCDYRLVEYVWNIPWEMKTVDHIEKGILRRAFAGILPDDARQRRKSAYPSTQSPTYLKAIQNLVLDILNEPNAPILPMLDAPGVRALAEGNVPTAASEFAYTILERIIQTNAWLQEYHITIC